MRCDCCELPTSIYRGTTPAHIFKTNADLTKARVFVTYRQNGLNLIEKTNDQLIISEDMVIVNLTQQETLKFRLGKVSAQIRYVAETGESDASDIIEFDVKGIFKEGILSY